MRFDQITTSRTFNDQSAKVRSTVTTKTEVYGHEMGITRKGYLTSNLRQLRRNK